MFHKTDFIRKIVQSLHVFFCLPSDGREVVENPLIKSKPRISHSIRYGFTECVDRLNVRIRFVGAIERIQLFTHWCFYRFVKKMFDGNSWKHYHRSYPTWTVSTACAHQSLHPSTPPFVFVNIRRISARDPWRWAWNVGVFQSGNWAWAFCVVDATGSRCWKCKRELLSRHLKIEEEELFESSPCQQAQTQPRLNVVVQWSALGYVRLRSQHNLNLIGLVDLHAEKVSGLVTQRWFVLGVPLIHVDHYVWINILDVSWLNKILLTLNRLQFVHLPCDAKNRIQVWSVEILDVRPAGGSFDFINNVDNC